MRCIVIAVAVGLAACGGASTTTSRSTTSSSVASTTEPGLTIRQIASLISQHRGELRNVLAQEGICKTASDEAYGDLGPKPGLDILPDILECQALLARSSTAAFTLSNALDGVKVPAEVQDLLDRTAAAAAELQTQADAFEKCMKSATTDSAILGCSLAERFSVASMDMLDVLDGWDPYV